MATIESQSKIKIISDALILIGETPLNSLSDNRYGATVGSGLFELIYENEIQSNRWRFACNKKALSRLTDTPLNEFQYVFQMPTDMLLPIGTYPKSRYEIYGKKLYTNNSSVDFEYLFKPDVSELPAYFSLLLAYALARDMVKPITESDNGVTIMSTKYTSQRNRAMYADAQGRPNRPLYDNPFVENR